MIIRCVFTDMDGTLLNCQHEIPPALAEKIRTLPVPFILASSRPPGGIWGYHRELALDSPLICFGGALILGADAQPLYSAAIPRETALRIASAGTASYSFYAGSKLYAKMDDWVRQEAEIIDLWPTGDSLPEGVDPHKLLCMGESPEIAALEKTLRAEYPAFTIVRSKDTYLEVVQGGVNKGAALRFLCAYLRISPEETLAFGDNFNDMDMLEAAGIPVAMGNAPEAVKSRAKYVAQDSDHAGMLEYLEKLVLHPAKK